MREEVAHGDARISNAGRVVSNRCVEIQGAPFDAPHQQHRGERLGNRCSAIRRVGRGRNLVFYILNAKSKPSPGMSFAKKVWTEIIELERANGEAVGHSYIQATSESRTESGVRPR